jgi:hypothetical protein
MDRNDRSEGQAAARRIPGLPLLLVVAVVLAAVVGWRLYLAFFFVKLIFQVIFFPIKLITEVLNGNGP